MRSYDTSMAKALILCCVFGLAIPVCAQGQSPTSPRPLPTQGQNGVQRPTTTSPQPNIDNGFGTQGAAQPTGSAQPNTAGGATGRAGLGNRTGAAGGAGAAGGGALGAAPQPRDNTRAPRSTGGGGAGAGRTITGSGSGSEGAKLTPAQPSTLQVIGEGNFEPALERAVEFPVLPDVGEALTLEGPLPLQEFMTEIGVSTGWNILMSEAAQGITLQYFSIAGMRPANAMEVIRYNGGIYYEFNQNSNILYLMTKEEFLRREFGSVEPQEFQINYADVDYITTALSALKSASGKLIVDSRTRRVYAWDTADNLAHMQKVFDELDVEMDTAEFRVSNTDFADVEGLLTSMLSPTGSILADPRTGIIRVWDAPEPLQLMRETVNRLDIPLQTETIPITFVYADDVAQYLEDATLISERGMVLVDPRSNSLILTDRPERLTRMKNIITQLDIELDTRTWVLKYADLDFVASQIEVMIPPEMGEIIINDPVRQITVTGQPNRLDDIDDLIATWDVQRDQVTIEVYFVDVSSGVEREFNINWSYFDMQGNTPVIWDGGSGFNTDSPVTIGQLPYQVPAYGDLQLNGAGGIERPILTNIAGEQVIDHFGGGSLAWTLDYLEQQNKANVLNSPRVTVLDGEPAIFNNATRVPYTEQTTSFQNSFSAAGSAFNTNRISFIDVGTLLTVVPRITSDKKVLLEIGAEDSTFIDKEITTNDQTSTVPQTTARRLETLVQVKDGETVVLGGLRRDNASKNVSGIPILKDIPGLGRIFRQPRHNSQSATLMIFITPTVIDDTTSPEASMLTEVEENISGKLRHDMKSVWGRVSDLISDGRNEFVVSIGRTGSISADGGPAALGELADVFAALKPRNVKVIIRPHRAAPGNIVAAVLTAAEESGVRHQVDETGAPIVPPLAGFEPMDAEGL